MCFFGQLVGGFVSAAQVRCGFGSGLAGVEAKGGDLESLLGQTVVTLSSSIPVTCVPSVRALGQGWGGPEGQAETWLEGQEVWPASLCHSIHNIRSITFLLLGASSQVPPAGCILNCGLLCSSVRCLRIYQRGEPHHRAGARWRHRWLHDPLPERGMAPPGGGKVQASRLQPGLDLGPLICEQVCFLV